MTPCVQSNSRSILGQLSSVRAQNKTRALARARGPRTVTVLFARERARTSPIASTSVSRTGEEATGTSVQLTPPVSEFDVDKDLWEVLDLCSDDELESVYNVLYGQSPFSPVVKSLVSENEPALIELRGRPSIMHKIESRFRFLAADSSATLRGYRPAYRETLLNIRERLEIQCSSNLSTVDLETEVFVHVLQNCSEYVQSHEDPDPSEAAAAAHALEGDGMATHEDGARRPNWAERVTAPLRFGLKDLLPTLAKLGSALTVSAVGRGAAQRMAGQLISQHVRYQAALKVCTGAAARTAATGFQQQVALQAAQRGLTAATARYGAMQGALACVGPLLWGWLALDLALKAVGTDYARVVRAVFIIAQIRLVRTAGFVNPSDDGDLQPPEPGYS